MANCDILDGRLMDDCLNGMAGVKTVFFFKHNQLVVTKDSEGVVTGIGAGTIFRFEQDQQHGGVNQEFSRQERSSYVTMTIDMTLFFISPEFMYTINHLKKGFWAIFFLDYDNRIRLLGETVPMLQIAGSDPTGVKAGDNRYANLSFQGIENDYAPFLEPYTSNPFDNFAGIVVTPGYTLPGLILQNTGNDKILVDIYDNKLDYN